MLLLLLASVPGFLRAQDAGWSTALSGNWSDPARWSPAAVPNSASADVTIAATGAAYTATLNQNATVDTLTLNSATATFDHASGRVLTLGDTLSLLAGTYRLAGTIQGGTIIPGGGSLQFQSGTLDGTTVAGDVVVASGVLILRNGASATGGVFLGQTGGFGGAIWLGSNLSSAASWTLAGSGSTLDWATSPNTAFTLQSGGTLTRTGAGSSNITIATTNQGAIAVTGGTLTFGRTVTNEGTLQVTSGSASFNEGLNNAASGLVEAVGADASLSLTGFTNAGILRASDSARLNFSGSYTTAHLGTVQLLTGATAQLSGTLDNTGAHLAAPGSGSYTLTGTVDGGTVAPDAIATYQSATLANLQFQGSLAHTSGQLTLNNTAVQGDLSVTGGTVILGTGASATGGVFLGQTGGFGGAIWLGSNLSSAASWTLAGSGSTLDWATSPNTAFTLQSGGTLTRTGAGSSNITIATTNQGAIAVTGGTLTFGRTVTNESTLQVTSGSASFNEGLNNAASGLVEAVGADASLSLTGFTNAGILRASDSARLNFSGSYTTAHLGTVQLLTGATAQLGGTLDNTGAHLGAPGSGSYTLTGTVNGGTVAVDAIATYQSATLANLQFQGSLAHTSGQLTLNNTAVQGDLSVTGGTVILGTGTTFTGGVFLGQTGGFGGTIWLGSNLRSAASWTLAGSGSTLDWATSQNTTFTLESGGTLTRTGAGSSNITIATTNQGAIAVTDGTLTFGHSLTNEGTLTGNGTVNGQITVANGGSISPGVSPGTLTFGGNQGSSLTLLDGAILNFELGTMSDLIVLAASTLLIGPGEAGSITVNLADSGGFTAGTYTLIDYGTTIQSISASSFTLGTTIAGYEFSFFDTGSAFVLRAIPEPSTWAALLGLGALVAASLRRGAARNGRRQA